MQWKANVRNRVWILPSQIFQQWQCPWKYSSKRGRSHKNLPTVVVWSPLLCRTSKTWRSQTKEPKGAQVMKCKGCLKFKTHTHTRTHLLPHPEVKEAVLMALWPNSSYGFVCHKKYEFNPLEVAVFVDWRKLWGREHLTVLYVDVSCLGREEMIKPPQVWVLLSG